MSSTKENFWNARKIQEFQVPFLWVSPHLATGGNSNFLSTTFKQLLVSLETNFGKDIPNQGKLKGACEVGGGGEGGGGWFAFPSYMTL